jgi:hypothetical protein
MQGAKKKAIKKETPYAGLRAPRPRKLLKKLDQNFAKGTPHDAVRT